jgi:hypothetical protein
MSQTGQISQVRKILTSLFSAESVIQARIVEDSFSRHKEKILARRNLPVLITGLILLVPQSEAG